MALSTRIAVLDRGAVVQVGTPAEVYRRPQSRFVGEFLGAANLLAGRLEAPTRVSLGDGLLLTVAPSDVPAGSPVLCLVRPEAIHVAAPAAGGVNRLGATLTSAVYLGGRWDCELALAGGVALRAEMSAGGGTAVPQPGEATVVAIHPEDIIVLPGVPEASAEPR